MREINESTDFLTYDTIVLSHTSDRWCSATPASPLTRPLVAPRLIAHTVVGLVSKLPLVPLTIPVLGMGLCESATSAVKARVISPTESILAFTKVPGRVHADRPFEIELSAVGLGLVAGAAVSIARWLSSHARLTITVEVAGQPRAEVILTVTAHLSCGSWMARALVRPASWADAASVTVVSLSLEGQPVPCECLPATLPVGYNHDPAPTGEVYAAAKAGNVAALHAALDAGGSTEEASWVRGDRGVQMRP